MLKVGDVLVFKAGNNTISKAIAFITKSDVSHAAMVYSPDEIVEMGLSGIGISKFELGEGEDVQVLRLDHEVESKPLVNAAKVYVDAKTKYGLPSLVIIAGYILYHEILPTPKNVYLTDLIIQKACVELDKYINKYIKKNPDKALVCSQLVHQVYHDCGKDYKIIMKDPYEKNLDSASNGVRFIDMIEASNSDFASFNPDEVKLPELTDEELIEQLYESLTEETDFATNEKANFQGIINHGQKFIDLLEKLIKNSKHEFEIDSLFITPADLAYNTKNLELIEKVNLTRK